MKIKQVFQDFYRKALLYFTFLCLTIFDGGFLFGQINSLAPMPNMPISPNASSLAIYADYPVSHYTGVPNINVPLYEIDFDGYRLPIKLNYHASGIKVDQEASWVGLGWSLDIGGAISRSVRGADDFLENYTSYPYIQNGYYNDGDIGNINDNYYYEYTSVISGVFEKRLKIDTEPDIFYCSFPGYSGKFIIDKSRGPVLMDKSENIKIEIVHDPSMGNSSPSDICFKVTAVEGTEYYYKQREKTWAYSRPGGLNDNSTDPNRTLDVGVDLSNFPAEFTSSWVLDKITTPNKRVISFFYEEETLQTPTQESCEIYNYIEPSSTGLNCGPQNGQVQSRRTKNRYSSRRLSSISWDGGSISFFTSLREDLAIWYQATPPKKLDKFIVYNNIGEQVKSVQFNYTYFNPSFTGEYQYVFKRLKLDNIVLDNDSKNNYVFSYFPGNLLAKNSNNKDYWGYHNGADYGAAYYSGLILGNDMYAGASKFGNETFAKIGTLNKITYPTGGITEFQFENNRYQRNAIEIDLPHTGSIKEKIIEVYNDYVQGAYVDIPMTATFQFTLLSNNRISIEKNIENTACPGYDQSFGYMHPAFPIGRLRRISPNSGTVFSYGMPQVNGSNSYCEYIEFNAPHNGSYQPTVLVPGTYVFEALLPPKDVYIQWRLNFLSALPEDGNSNGGEDPGTDIVQGGGLRISKIINGNNIRTFNYPIGKLLIPPVLAYNKSFKCYDFILGPDGNYHPMLTTRKALVRLSNSSNTLSTVRHGNAVGYDWVEEATLGRGKTKYTFFNEPEDPLSETTPYTESYFPYAPTSIDFKNGLLDQIDYFKGNEIVKTTVFNYNVRYSQSIKGFMYNEEFNQTLAYYLKFAWYLKTGEVNTMKQNSDAGISEITQYDYNDYFQLSSIRKKIGSKWKEQKIKYADDFSDAASQSMVAKYMIGVPLERIDLYNDLVIGGEKVVFFDTLGLTLPKRIFRLKADQAMDESQYQSHFHRIVEFDRYNSKGKILQLWNKGNITSFLWGYRNTAPVIQAVNTAYAELHSIVENDGIQDLDEDPSENTISYYANILRNNLPNSMITAYVQKPMVGLRSEIDIRGLETTYSYDTQGRLTEVKDHNGDIIDAYRYNYRGASLPYVRIDGITPLRGDAWLHGNYSGQEYFPGAFRVTITNRINGSVITFDIDDSMNKSFKFPWGNYDVFVESLEGLSSSDFYFEVWGEPSTNGVLEDVHLDQDGNAFQVFIN